MNKKKICPWSLIGALFFALCTIIGEHFASFEREIGGFGNLADLRKYIPVFIILSGIYYVSLYVLLNKTYKAGNEPSSGKILEFYEKHVFLITFIVILTSWILYLTIFYPGSVYYDGYNQLNQSMGVTELTNHHPVLSTFFIGVIFRLGSIVDDNFGVFLYVLIQSIVTSGVFAMSVVQIRKMGMSIKTCICTMLFFSVVPVWGSYSQAMGKDMIYNAVFVWFLINFLKMLDDLFHKKRKIISPVFLLSAFLTCALRQNGKFAVFAAIIFLLFMSRAYWKRIGILLLALLMVVLGYEKMIIPATGAIPGSAKEVFSIPFQQTAKYMRTYPEEVTDEEFAAIDKVLSAGSIPDKYNPLISDKVKDTIRNPMEEGALKEYFKIWFKMFFKHPGVYIEAFLQQCYGYLDPFHHISPLGDFQNYIEDGPLATGDFDIHYIMSDKIRNQLGDYEYLWTKMFPLTLLTYPGIYTWISVFCILLLCKKRLWKQLSAMVIPIVYILTCIASPVNGYLRYMLPVMAAMPILLAWVVKEARVLDSFQPR